MAVILILDLLAYIIFYKDIYISYKEVKYSIIGISSTSYRPNYIIGYLLKVY